MSRFIATFIDRNKNVGSIDMVWEGIIPEYPIESIEAAVSFCLPDVTTIKVTQIDGIRKVKKKPKLTIVDDDFEEPEVIDQELDPTANEAKVFEPPKILSHPSILGSVF